jgi:hypothetical protein
MLEDHATHATQNLRAECLRSMRDVLSRENYEGAVRCSMRLYEELPNKERIDANVVLVAYGGGKDSSYTLAFVRTMQLILSQVYGRTFHMRVATNRHAGMPRSVMENIDRAYRALRLDDDPDCELLLVDGRRVREFDVDLPQAPDVVRRNRLDILMAGHRTAADGRPTFCNACNLSMVNSFGLAAGHRDGVDLIVTGDSRQEQRDYYLWVSRLARRFGLQPERGAKPGFQSFLKTLDNVSQAYFTDIHGTDAADVVQDHSISSDVRTGLKFFSIYDDTAYASGDHWELLTDHLGFTFDDIAFSFTESDCANPALMAHLRALKAERRHGQSYASGLAEYVDFAVSLMHKKEFPAQLVDIMRERYDGNADGMRTAVGDYAVEAYGLSEEQLVAMVYSPFTDKAATLEEYLAAEQPDLAGRAPAIRELLENAAWEGDASLTERLERLSGLELEQLRVLYGSSLRLPTTVPDRRELIDSILEGDPHKKVIETRHSKDGPVVHELVSGR